MLGVVLLMKEQDVRMIESEVYELANNSIERQMTHIGIVAGGTTTLLAHKRPKNFSQRARASNFQ